jgi:acyl carrier protein
MTRLIVAKVRLQGFGGTLVLTAGDAIRTQLIQIVAEVADVPVDKVLPDAMLADLDIDSLRGLRIVAAVEKRWGIVVNEDTIGRIRSMKDIFALVETTPS